MNIAGMKKKTASVMATAMMVAASLFGASSDKPKMTDTLNDFNPEYPVGIYIQEIASNQVFTSVKLTNGVLTVGSESINVAEPSHTVVTTNVIDGRIVIVTNTYDAVYQDNLSKTLESYATIKKAVVTQNEDGTFTTNWVDVAYLNDIPPDDKKADKVINLWDYYCQQVGGTLTRAESKIAPFAAWSWDGNTNGIYHIDLMYTNGVWSCSVNAAAPPLMVRGEDNAKTLNFGDYTFKSTNENGVAYVVYTDALNKARKDFIDNELVMFVSKTNMTGMADAIQEDQLTTLQGIVDTLLRMRRELRDMSGDRGMTLSFTNVTEGLTLTLRNAEIQGFLGRVDIDWGDGTKTATNFPCSHTYSGSVSGVVEVAISGSIKSISGGIDGVTIYPFASWSDGDNSKLFSVSIDRTVGLEEFGDYAFAYSSLKSLSFAREARVSKFGKYCFYSSGIDTLYGMPEVDDIPDYCFAKCGIQSMNGLAATVRSIGAGAFSDCTSLRSLGGIGTTAGPQTLGDSAFANCTALVSLSGLDQTGITEIPDNCFSMCSSLSSIAYLNQGTTKIGKNAFLGTAITTLNGMPQTITEIGDSAFRGCSGLTDARALWNTSLTSVGDMAFDQCPLRNVTFPESLSYLGATSLYGLDISGATGDGYKATVKFRGKTLWAAQVIPVSATNATELGFSWGLPKAATNDTLIIGVDGEMYYDPVENVWVTNNTEIAFFMSEVPAGTTVMLGNIQEAPLPRDAVYDGSNIVIDWGDGELNSEMQHTYTTPFSPTIKVLGKVAGISGKSEAYPFIAISGSPTNTYLIGATFAKSETIRTIGDYAFAGCTSIPSIEGLTANIETIGIGSFRGATSLNSLSFLSGTEIDTVPSECFRGCSSITSLAGLPSSVDTIGTGAFRECSALTSIDALPSSVTAIPQDAFRRCTSLTNINGIAAGFTGIGKTAFAECIRVEEFSLSPSTAISPNAFSDMGVDADTKTDEDGISYRTVYKFPNGNYYQAAQCLGLEDASGNPSSGLDKYTSKIECIDDEQLVWHSEGSVQRWEVLVPALEIELKDVMSNTTFEVARTWVASQASVIWNWGDGTTMWVSQSPGPHTYTHDGTKSYTIRIKGLLDSISAEGGAAGGAYIRPQGETENPFLVGFRLPDNTPMRSVGNYSFSRCPNLKNINRTNLPRSRALAPPVKREEPKTRLEQMFQSKATLPIEYGEFCFYGSGIEDLSGLPTNTTSLAVGLFSRNESLKSLETLNGDRITDIGAYCFEQTGVTNLFGYPSSIGYVGDCAFFNCYDLSSLYGIPTNIIEIGYGSFDGCINLTSLYGFPDSLTTIGIYSLRGTGITSLGGIPSSVDTIKDGAFNQCTSLTTTEGLGASITNLSSGLFMGCTNLREVVGLPASIKTISEYCFFNDGNITNIVINDTIEEIGPYAFPNIGSGEEQFEDRDGNLVSCIITFHNRTCAEIRELWGTNFLSTSPTVELVGWDGYIISEGSEWKDIRDTLQIKISVASNTVVNIGTIGGTNENGYVVYWGDSTVSEGGEHNGKSHAYEDAGAYTVSIVGRFTSLSSSDSYTPFIHATIGEMRVLSFDIGNNCGVVELGDSCFRGMAEVTNMNFLSSTPICTIGPMCFADCTNLVDIKDMPISLNEISVSSFEGCRKLESLVGLSDTITNIPNRCFKGCTALRNLKGIPSVAEGIGYEAFAGCTSLTNIAAMTNTTVVSIGDRAFYGCSSLKSILGFPETLSSLGLASFENCSSLPNLNGFSGVLTNIPARCFYGCTELNSITGMYSVVTIGSNCFENCSALTSGNGFSIATNIMDSGMFKGCTSLKDIEFSEGVIDVIKEDCFMGCQQIRSVVLAENVTSIGRRCFYGCNNLTNLVVHSSNTVMGANSLDGIGTNAPDRRDEYGNTFKSDVFFDKLTIQEIKELPNFPFGAPHTTVFRGTDGFVISGVPYRKAVEFDVVPSYAGQEFELEKMSIRQGCLAAVSWGDGTGTNNLSSGWVRHTYNSTTNHTITIVGDVLEISNTNGLGCFVSPLSGGSPFYQNTELKSVRIPSGSTLGTIGERAFNYNIGLTNVVIDSSSLTNIGRQAFRQCHSLSSIEFNVDGLKSLGNEAFAYSSYPTDVNVFPDSVDTFGLYCFSHNDALNRLWDEGEGGNLKNIYFGCFNECTNIQSGSGMAFWPTGVDVATTNVLYNLRNLSTLYFNTNCNGIMDNALYNIGENIKTRKDELGSSFKATVYILHKTCAEVMGNGFPDAGISHFPFGAGTWTKFICSDGFISKASSSASWTAHKYSATIKLTGISAGSVVTIGPTTYPSGKWVTWYFGDGTYEETSNSTVTHTYSSAMSECMITVSGSITGIAGTSTTPWITITGGGTVSSALFIDGSGLVTVGDYSFRNCSGLQSITIDSSRVRTIGNNVFENCTSLTYFKLPRTTGISYPVSTTATYTIGNSAFKGCSALTEVNIQNATYSHLGDEAFSGCSNIEKIYLRTATMPNIGNNAFYGIGTSSSVTNKTNQYGKTYKAEIRYSAGLSANPLQGDAEMIIANNYVTKIGINNNCIITTDDGYVGYNSGWKPYEYAVSFLAAGFWAYRFGMSGSFNSKEFWNEYGAEAVRIGNLVNISKIPYQCFKGWKDLESIVRTCGAVPSVTRIEQEAFKDCKKLKKMVGVTSSVAYIGPRAFEGCQSLQVGESVTFPNCTYLGVGAFSGCTSLSNIRWINGSASIGAECFDGCSSLTSLVGLPKLTHIPDKCFRGTGLSTLSELPSTTKTIGMSAFEKCTNIKDVSRLPSSVEELCDNALLGIPYTNKFIRVPQSLVRLGKDAYGKPDERPPYLPLKWACIFNLGANQYTKFGSQSLYNVANYIMTPMTCTNIITVMNQNRVCLYNLPMIYASDGTVEAIRDTYCVNELGRLHNTSWGVYASYTGESSMSAFFDLRGTFSSHVSVQANFGAGSIVSYGDMSDLVHKGGAHTYTQKPRPLCVHVCDISADMPSGKPVVESANQMLCYVNSAIIPPVAVVGANAFSNLKKCRSVKFYSYTKHYKNRPTIRSNAFSNIGTDLSYQYINGIPYKTVITLDSYTSLELLNNVAGTFPFGAPVSTVFVASDGYVRYSDSAWRYLDSTMTFTVRALDTLDGVNYYNYFINQVTFKNNEKGYVSIDGGPYREINGAFWLNWARAPKNTFHNHTIKIFGRIDTITGLISVGFKSPYITITSLSKTDANSIRVFNGFGDANVEASADNIRNFLLGVEELGANAFSGMGQITDMSILPTTLKVIGDSCFSGCNNLKGLNGIGKCTSLTTIGRNAFYNCINLKCNSSSSAISTFSYLPQSVQSIGDRAFWGVGYLHTQSVDYYSPMHLCFKGKTVGQISKMSGFPWNITAAAANWTIGHEGIMYLYGIDGYTVDVSASSGWHYLVGNELPVYYPPHAEWKIVYQQTGL